MRHVSDRSAGFWTASAGSGPSEIRASLADAKIAVDKRHLVELANQMVTEVRQHVTCDLLGRRGTVADPVWVKRGCC